MPQTSGPPGLVASIISKKALPSSYTAVVQTPSGNSVPEIKAANQPTQRNDARAKWIIGWKIPVAIVANYVLALLVSITHLLMFMFLDNKPVSSYRQPYVTTASTILATIFKLGLQVSLGIAFTQRLWSILRQSACKLRTIENLFNMRSNPFLALRWAVLQSAPLLSLFTIVLWSLQIVTNFPPGALTVVNRPHETTVLTQVMALNMSNVGNNVFDLEANSVAMLAADAQQSVLELEPQRRGSILRLASQTMIASTITTSPSPCGSNCTYSLQFPGPYLLCDAPLISVGGLKYPGPSYPLYVGVWSNPLDDITIPYQDQLSLERRTESVSVASFNITLLTPLGVEQSGGIFTEMSFQRCRPGQTIYNVNVTYQDGIQKFTVQADPGSTRLLTDLTIPTPFNYNNSYSSWSEPSLQWLSDANNMAIIEAMTLALAGQYTVQVESLIGAGSFTYVLNNGTNIVLANSSTLDDIYSSSTGSSETGPGPTGPQNGTIIALTAINRRPNNFNTTEGPDLATDPDILNEMLQNITLSLMNTFPLWSTEVNATQTTFRNVYSFSNKLNLILPYYVSLAVALPLLVLGGLSLYQNGVSATDGGFLQIVTTTSTSKALHAAASGGALGGQENVPEELRDLKIRYGELISGEEESKVVTRRVGFGVEDEVVPIQKGVPYGCVVAERNRTRSIPS